MVSDVTVGAYSVSVVVTDFRVSLSLDGKCGSHCLQVAGVYEERA